MPTYPQGQVGQLTHLRRRCAEMRAKEERLTAANRRLKAEIDAVKVGKEATKIAYKAAELAGQAVSAEVTGQADAAVHASGRDGCSRID